MNSFADVIASYVVNAVWQVPVIAAAGWMVKRAMDKVGRRAEHQLWVLTLWLAAVVPALPLLLLLLHGLLSLYNADGRSGGTSSVVAAAQGGFVHAKGTAVLPLVMVLGVCVVYLSLLLYFAVRLGWSMYRTYALVREAQVLELEPEAAEQWSRCKRAFGLRDVRLLTSSRIDGPVTMGFVKPVLMMPDGFADRCMPHELLAALAHECAHIERRDFAKNVAYEAVSLLIAFHPVTWMLKARIAETREMICDEIAVCSVMEPRVYAQSLLRLATMISNVSRAVPTNAIGIFDANILEKRIMTIRAKKQTMSRRYAVMIPAAILLFTMAIGEAGAKGVMVRSEDGSQSYGQLYKIGKGVSAPQLIHSVDPEFPEAERGKKAKLQGTVVISLVVDASGVPHDVRVVKSLADFDPEAIKAVKQYRFKPATKDGKPVAVELRVEVNFQRF